MVVWDFRAQSWEEPVGTLRAVLPPLTWIFSVLHYTAPISATSQEPEVQYSGSGTYLGQGYSAHHFAGQLAHVAGWHIWDDAIGAARGAEKKSRGRDKGVILMAIAGEQH